MRVRFTTKSRSLLTLAMVGMLLFHRADVAQALELGFDAKGLSSILVDGKNLLHQRQPRVRSVVFEQTSTNDAGLKQYKFERIAEAAKKASFDAATKTHRLEYSWGSAEIQYVPGKDRLDFSLTLRNDSPHLLANFDVTFMEIAFPSPPTSGKKGRLQLRPSLDNLAITDVNMGKHRMLICNLSIDPPMRLGLDKTNDKNGLIFPVVMKGGVSHTETGSYAMEPHGLPRLPAGKSITLRATMRSGPLEMPVAKLLEDAYEKFRDFHSPSLKWDDRRPIAMMIRSSTSKGHQSASNPRGWMNDPKLDVLSASGKADFRAKMLKDAARSVKVIKDTGGQGMILWDLEGQENPHPISFIGDPRLAKRLAPEMDEIADEYFKVFTDAGLRTGICIRPTQAYFDEEKKKWLQGTGSDGMPGRSDEYSHLRPKDLATHRFYPIAERLSDRIAYAKKRWGCTLFYVDTNGVNRKSGEDQKFRWHLIEANVWKQVQAKHPDVLIIPELSRDDLTFHAAYWAYTAGYNEVDMKGYRTPDPVRALFPNAFSVIVINDGDINKNRTEIKLGVERGDILMFRGWYADPRNAWVKTLYDEVKSGKQSAK